MSERYCHVGCYPGADVPEALHVLKCDTETGAICDVQAVTGVEGASYLQIDREGHWLYTVLGDERKLETKGRVVRFALEGAKVGPMDVLADLPCPAPCHVGLSPDGRDVSFAAYRAGTAGCVAASGAGAVRSVVLSDEGVGPNRKRQTKAFAHFTFFTPDGRWMGVINLGCDRIHFFDPQTMVEDEAMMIRTDPGDGPRHAVWSRDGRFLFVINELSSTVSSFSFLVEKSERSNSRTIGQFSCVGKWSTLPADFSRWEPDGETLATKASAIKLTADGKFLLASNRGYDSIAVFAVDEGTGRLELKNISRLAGRSPRDFELMPGDRFAVVGYELDDGIQSYRFDRETGALTPVGEVVKAWHPVCFKFGRSDSDGV